MSRLFAVLITAAVIGVQSIQAAAEVCEGLSGNDIIHVWCRGTDGDPRKISCVIRHLDDVPKVECFRT
jgi:hypothetical protein